LAISWLSILGSLYIERLGYSVQSSPLYTEANMAKNSNLQVFRTQS